MKLKEPMPIEYFFWQLAFETGWTMDYIMSLPMSVWHEYLSIKDALDKAGVK